jgi:hypothetical protein
MRDFAELSKEANIVSDENLESLASMSDQLLGMADTLSSQLLPYMSKFGELADGALTVITTGLSTLWAGLKSLWTDQTFAQTAEKMNAAFDKGVEGWERRRAAVKQRAEARQAASNRVLGGGDVLHSADPMEKMKEIAERSAQGPLRQPLSSWQTAGAAIRFSPEKAGIDAIARNTGQLIRETVETRNAIIGKGRSDGGFGAAQTF